MFENFGKVESVVQCLSTTLACSTNQKSLPQRFAKAADGQLVKVDRHPPSKSHKVLKDMGGYEFSLTVGHTEDPVTHEFGTAVVTMPDKGDSFTAMAMLTDVVYVSSSSPMHR